MVRKLIVQLLLKFSLQITWLAHKLSKDDDQFNELALAVMKAETDVDYIEVWTREEYEAEHGDTDDGAADEKEWHQ